MAENENELKDRVESWLSTQGFPLEMQVARVLKDNGFTTLQADYYLDPDEDRHREIDVIAYMSSIDRCFYSASLVIECKVSKAKPWVLFSAEPPDAPEYLLRSTICTRDAFPRVEKVVQMKTVTEAPVFRFPDRVGYGIAPAFDKDQRDLPYGACMTAAKAARARADLADSLRSDSKGMAIVDVSVPVVVVDGHLFEAYLGARGELQVNEIDRGVLVWRNRVSGRANSIIHIVTLPAFGAFARQASTSFETLISCLKQVQ